MVRALAEVTWIDSGAATCGVGLRVAGMTAMDRYLLRSMRGFFQDDAERYR